jgi:hypothetical protein
MASVPSRIPVNGTTFVRVYKGRTGAFADVSHPRVRSRDREHLPAGGSRTRRFILLGKFRLWNVSNLAQWAPFHTFLYRYLPAHPGGSVRHLQLAHCTPQSGTIR